MALSGKSYGRQWDQFYSSIKLRGKRPLWDVEPEEAVAADYEFFAPHFDPYLPLIDVGCGTGIQTAYLAEKFELVVGIDVAASAIEEAHRCYCHRGSNLRFELIDEGDEDFFPAIHRQLGDANIYMRGVMHQILDKDLQKFLEALVTLMGDTGRLFLVEVAENIRDYLSAGSGGFSDLPAIMRRTLTSHLPPRGVSLAHLASQFSIQGVEMLESGETSLVTNIRFRSQEPIRIPAVQGIFAVKQY